MEILGGYTNTLLKVDLSRRTSKVESLPPELIRHFRGGAAVNAALAYQELKPGLDPYGPDNQMIFGLGPLVGTMTPGAGKGNLTSMSPVRGFMGVSGHGLFGSLKFAGFDHLIITGRAERPMVLRIEDEQVTFLNAEDLWGQDTFDTTDALWARMGERFNVSCIGPAGERRVRDAGILTNKYAAFARTGMGAVMGSKNLKAIAVYGSKGVEVADRNGFLKAAKKLFGYLRSDPNLLNWRAYGTLISLETFSRLGLYARKNYQSAFHEDLLEIFPLDDFVRRLKDGDVACQACPVGCKHHIHFGGGAEPETRMAVSCMNSVMQSFGTFCLVEGWKEAVRCAETAARMGLDFMSTGGLIAFVMELHQRGILTERDTGGRPALWGDGEFVREWIRRIAYREGLGDTLAEGLDRASELLGEETRPYAMVSKGLGMLYDPRVRLDSTEIFSQFTNVRGYISNVSVAMVERTPEQIARYCTKIGLPPEAVGRIVGAEGYNVGRLNKWTEDVTSVLEILGVCQFPPFQRIPLDLWAQTYSAVVGVDTGREDLMRASENMWHTRRAFNVRQGAGRDDDTCPSRFFSEPVDAGPRTFPPLDEHRFRDLVRSYYQERGWDPDTGVPPRRVLESIGLE